MLPTFHHRIFRAVWMSANILLVASVLALLYSGGWEYSVRRYLDGFSDAIVPNVLPAEQKVEAILTWMRTESSRAVTPDPALLTSRNPEVTLNYEQLLKVCGTATNAFLNLARSSDLQVRRLLLLTPGRTTKHVVAEVLVNDRWIIVDPTYRTILRDAQGHFLTRRDLQDPVIFAQATSTIPGYRPEYNYERFAHVRVARIPLEGFHLRPLLDSIYPGWDEAVDWSLLLERESFLYFFLSLVATLLFVFLRVILGWYADRRLRIPRFHLREHVVRAGEAFFSTPEIKE
jgi:Transglutaminase-like superfamily